MIREQALERALEQFLVRCDVMKFSGLLRRHVSLIKPRFQSREAPGDSTEGSPLNLQRHDAIDSEPS